MPWHPPTLTPLSHVHVPCVRGRAPETQVGLSGYSVTIKLCDSLLSQYRLDKLRHSATIELRDDNGWRLLYMLLWLGMININMKVMVKLVVSMETPRSGWMRIHSTFNDEKRVLHRGGPLAPLLCLLSCVDSFDTAPPPPQDLLAGLLYTAPPPSAGDGSFGSCLSSP
ncbi:uncharacterized protein UDID_18845 [Ustilago sp. UG-2017a]|nr:uncharacterized protein UDID_18845 [Ustilago sp. UG-2017a]